MGKERVAAQFSVDITPPCCRGEKGLQPGLCQHSQGRSAINLARSPLLFRETVTSPATDQMDEGGER